MSNQVITEKVLPGYDDKQVLADQFTVLSPVEENRICEEVSPVRNGYGACSKSGCNCKEYEGNASTCGNQGCGHAYSDHW